MTLPALEEHLTEATRALQDAREVLMEADLAILDAERYLKVDESIARVEGVEGKNADEREAHLRLKLAARHGALDDARRVRIRAAADWDISVAEVRMVRGLIALYSTEVV
jgi:hypothetical protein